MGDKGRSNVYYDADLEVGAPALLGAPAFQPAGAGWGIKAGVTFITVPTWRARSRPTGRAGFPAGRGRMGDKGRSNVY